MSSTYVTHICVVLAFYVPLIGLSVVHKPGEDLAALASVTMGNMYILVPLHLLGKDQTDKEEVPNFNEYFQ